MSKFQIVATVVIDYDAPDAFIDYLDKTLAKRIADNDPTAQTAETQALLKLVKEHGMLHAFIEQSREGIELGLKESIGDGSALQMKLEDFVVTATPSVLVTGGINE